MPYLNLDVISPPEPANISAATTRRAPYRIFHGNMRRALLMLLLIVVLLGFMIESILNLVRFEEERVVDQQSELEIARLVAITMETYVHGILDQQHAMGVHLTWPVLLPPDQANLVLQQSDQRSHVVRRFTWLSPKGRVVAASDLSLIGRDESDRPYFRAILAGSKAFVSDLYSEDTGDSRFFSISQGIVDQSENLQGVIATAIDSSDLEDALAVPRKANADVTVIDRRGAMVYHYPKLDLPWERRKLIGNQHLLHDSLLGEETTGTFVSELDGRERLGGFAPISGIGWVAGAYRLRTAAVAGQLQDLATESVLHIIIVGVACLIALTVARHITSPLYELREHARAFGRGEYGRRIALGGPAELSELASTLEQMGAAVQLREHQLRLSEERFRRLAENAPDIIYRYRLLPKPGFEYVSPATTLLTGYTPEEHYANPKLGLRIVHPDDRHLMITAMRDITKLTTPLAVRWVRKDGTLLWTEQRNVAICDQSGQVIAIEGIARDITKHKQAEEALQTSEERFRSIYEHSPIGIEWFDATGRLVHANAATLEMFGISRLEAVQGFELLNDPNLSDDDKRRLAAGEPIRTEILFDFDIVREHALYESTKSGVRLLDTLITPIAGDDADTKGFLVQVQDITERREAETALREARDELEARVKKRTAELSIANEVLRVEIEERARAEQTAFRLAAIVGASDDAVFGLTPEGILTSWNPGAARLYGHSSDEAIGQSISLVFPPERLGELPGLLERLRQGDGLKHYESVRMRKDGRPVEVSITSSPIKDAGGKVVGISTIARDITESKMAAEALRRAHAELELWIQERELIAMDLHDGVIQSLYGVVLGISAQERMLGEASAATKRSLHDARTQIAGVIQELRNYIYSLRPQQIGERCLKAGLEAVVRELQVNALLRPELQLVHSVEGLLGPSAVNSLLYIAREATSNVIRHAGASQVRVRLEKANQHLVLTVRDNGQGFHPGSPNGSAGQGLRNMAERARLLGGRVVVQSMPKRGTEIRVEIPLGPENLAR